jgi:hypothetical protein
MLIGIGSSTGRMRRRWVKGVVPCLRHIVDPEEVKIPLSAEGLSELPY